MLLSAGDGDIQPIMPFIFLIICISYAAVCRGSSFINADYDYCLEFKSPYIINIAVNVLIVSLSLIHNTVIPTSS